MALKCCIMIWLFQGIQNNCSATEALRNRVCNCSLLLFQPFLMGKMEQKFIKFMIALKKKKKGTLIYILLEEVL